MNLCHHENLNDLKVLHDFFFLYRKNLRLEKSTKKYNKEIVSLDKEK